MEGNALLLLDDRAGRQVAKKLNIPTTGLVGILLLAKEKGIVENVGSLLEELRSKGYWLSDEIMDVARRLAGSLEYLPPGRVCICGKYLADSV